MLNQSNIKALKKDRELINYLIDYPGKPPRVLRTWLAMAVEDLQKILAKIEAKI